MVHARLSSNTETVPDNQNVHTNMTLSQRISRAKAKAKAKATKARKKAGRPRHMTNAKNITDMNPKEKENKNVEKEKGKTNPEAGPHLARGLPERGRNLRRERKLRQCAKCISKASVPGVISAIISTLACALSSRRVLAETEVSANSFIDTETGPQQLRTQNSFPR